MMLSEYTRRLKAVSEELENLAAARRVSAWKVLPETPEGKKAQEAVWRLAEVVSAMGIGMTTANNTGSIKGNG